MHGKMQGNAFWEHTFCGDVMKRRKPQGLEYWRKRRAETADSTVPVQGLVKRHRIDLGLALFSRYALPGVCYSCDDIALWCGCSNAAIHSIECRALRKLRRRLQDRQGGRLWRELMTELFERRSPAQRKLQV